MYSIEKKPDALLVDYRLPAGMKNKIESFGIEIVETVAHPNLYEAVKGHPDLMGCPLKNITIIVPYLYSKKYKDFERFSTQIGATLIEKKYPNHIKYNVATFGRHALGYFKYVDKAIISVLESLKISLINTIQGYSKCSTLILDSNNLVTSDISIFKAINEIYGMNIAMINSGDIILEGFEYGFIGGASSLIDNKKVAFMGSLEHYNNGKAIINVLDSLEIDAVFLANSKLQDYGSMVPLYLK